MTKLMLAPCHKPVSSQTMNVFQTVMTIPAERDVEVIAEESAQGNVPATPKLGDG